MFLCFHSLLLFEGVSSVVHVKSVLTYWDVTGIDVVRAGVVINVGQLDPRRVVLIRERQLDPDLLQPGDLLLCLWALDSQGRMLLYRFFPRFSGSRAESRGWLRPTSFRSW